MDILVMARRSLMRRGKEAFVYNMFVREVSYSIPASHVLVVH